MTEADKVEVLSADELPAWFSYPRTFLRLIESGITRFDPWWIFDRKFAREKLEGLKTRYPARDLVPFARNQGNDDVACWESVHPSKVIIIHDYADPGWEERKTFESFSDWFRSAIEDFIEFEL